MMTQANSVAGIFTLMAACSLVVSGSSEINSPTTSTIAPNTPHQLSNDNGTIDSLNKIQNQIELKFHTAISSILDKYFIDLKTHVTAESDVSELENNKNDLKTQLADFLDNKLSASLLLENNELNNKLLQLNDTLKKINQDQEQTLAEYLEINKKYTKSLETLITFENRVLSLNDHQVNLEKNFTIFKLKLKDIIHENDNNNTKVGMESIIDNLQSVILSKNQQYSKISVELEKKVDENNKMIQESIALKKEQAEKLKAIENEYQSNLINKQQEVEILKEIIFEDFDESADLLKTLTEIMKFNEDNVPDKLLEKRQKLLIKQYNENQTVVVDYLRKLFDDAASTSNSQFSNKYFCNKKISYYDWTSCGLLSENLNSYAIDLGLRNLAVIPKDIFTGFENVESLDLSWNRLYYLESGTFNNLSKLKDLSFYVNQLLSLPKDIFTGLKNLTDLNLAYNRLDYLESGTFNNLSNLQVLYISFNNLTALSSDMFNGLEKLKILYIPSNKLNSLQPGTFKDLSNLQQLSIGHNNLTELSRDIFNGLEKLTWLNLSGNKLNSLQPGIFNNLSKLQNLGLDNNNLTALSSNILNGLEKLEVLGLSSDNLNSLEPGTFNNLSNLQKLDISHNNLTELSLDIFNGLEKLTWLDLSGNKLNSLQPGTIKDLSNLQRLSIGHNNLTELSRDIFNGLEKLTWLDLSGNKLNSLQPGIFNNLSNLKDLWLHKNHLTSLPKNIFTGLKNLRVLLLLDNQLSYFDLDIFNDLPALHELNIKNNNLTTDSIYMLKNTYFFRNFELWL